MRKKNKKQSDKSRREELLTNQWKEKENITIRNKQIDMENKDAKWMRIATKNVQQIYEEEVIKNLKIVAST